MNIDNSKMKEKLEEEKKMIENDLQSIGVKNSKNSAAWEASQKNVNDEEPSDRTETADAITNYESDVAIVSTLDTRLLEINDALERIEKGTYGTCKVCKRRIEEDRLEANPAASTCKEHLNS